MSQQDPSQESPADAGPATPRTILCVPGQWATRADFLSAVIEHTDYLFAGMVLMHRESRESFKLEVCQPDPGLDQAFAIAGRGRVSEEDIAQIAEHTLCLYLVADGGTPETARACMRAACALLDAGGLAVKVESAGIAHTADGWTALAAEAQEDPYALLTAYVIYVGSATGYYSCGMHNLGLPDCVVEAAIPPDDAAQLMHGLLGYLLVEQAEVHDGETFSLGVDEPRYRLSLEPCTEFESDNPFHNPYGVWKLRPV